MRRIGPLVLVLALDCGVAVAKPPPALPPQPPLVLAGDERGLTFSDPAIAHRFDALLKAARKHAPERWRPAPFMGREAWNGGPIHYTRSWTSPETFDPAPNRRPTRLLARGSISLQLETKRQSPALATNFRLSASRRSPDRWGAQIEYAVQDAGQVGGSFRVIFYHPQHNTLGSFDNQFAFALPYGTYAGSFRPKGSNHEFHLDLEVQTGQQRHQQIFTTLPDAEVLEYFESPESFRDSVLAELATLRDQAKKKVAAGDVGYTDWTHVRSANPPRRGAPPAGGVPAAQKQHLLADALQELDRREEIIREHYQEMHAVMVEAFPLGDALRPLNEKRSKDND